MAARTPYCVTFWRSCVPKVDRRFVPLVTSDRSFCINYALSAPISTNESSPLVEDGKSFRDVPFMFLPHTVKKAYHVHEVSTTLPKIFDKYKWLTKTLSTPGLPRHYDLDLATISPSIAEAFHDSLLQTVAFQKSPKNSNKARFTPERINFSLISNFLRLSLIEEGHATHLSPQNSFMYHEPIFETHWPRNYKFYQTKFRPSFIIRTRNGIEQMESVRGKKQQNLTDVC